jgi:hypothetical protein
MFKNLAPKLFSEHPKTGQPNTGNIEKTDFSIPGFQMVPQFKKIGIEVSVVVYTVFEAILNRMVKHKY